MLSNANIHICTCQRLKISNETVMYSVHIVCFKRVVLVAAKILHIQHSFDLSFFTLQLAMLKKKWQTVFLMLVLSIILPVGKNTLWWETILFGGKFHSTPWWVWVKSSQVFQVRQCTVLFMLYMYQTLFSFVELNLNKESKV